MFSQEYQDKIQQDFFHQQCCPKSVKTTLNRIFSRPMLSQEYQDKIQQDFFHQQCCPKSIKATLKRILSRPVLSGAPWTTLQKVFTCVMLS